MDILAALDGPCAEASGLSKQNPFLCILLLALTAAFASSTKFVTGMACTPTVAWSRILYVLFRSQ